MTFKCSIEVVHYRNDIQLVLEAENILLLDQGTSACKYHSEVMKEVIYLSRMRVWKFIKRYELRLAAQRTTGFGRHSKITDEVWKKTTKLLLFSYKIC